ncbi:hypothetical protein SPONN_2800 [uncultured Candidatus Thioglobus sp.]|nr:hypothetical protein SPONN_2800 [uncultured Candidatus Thioglobus sp.]
MNNLYNAYNFEDFDINLSISKDALKLEEYSQTYNTSNINDVDISLTEGKHTIFIESFTNDNKWILYYQSLVDIKADEVTVLNVKLHRVPTAKHAKYLQQQQKILTLSKTVSKGDNQRYIDNNNGIITDKVTKLMWKKCAEGLFGDSCNKGKSIKLKWLSAKDYAKESRFAKYDNWRIPTRSELETLSYCSKGRKPIKLNNDGYLAITNNETQNGHCNKTDYQVPTINQTLFPRTPIKRFWSAEKLIDYKRFAFYIHFGAGSIYYDDINNTNRFRLVRNITGQIK